MAIRSRRLAEWAHPLMYPGSSLKRLLIVGDSHASMSNGDGTSTTPERWFHGIVRTWPINIHGYYSQLGSTLHTTTPNGSMSGLAIGPTQHPTDGCIAPHDVGRLNGNFNGQLWVRSDAIAANFLKNRNGNFLNQAALNVKIGWWARSDSYASIRMRSGYTDDSYTEDTSGIDLRGAGAYASRTMPIAAAAKTFRWDSICANVSGEGTFIGHRFELQSPGGGVSIASIGNGGRTAADYAHATTICNDARWTDWLTMFGPYDRILFIYGTNMSAGEAANITGVWGPNALTAAQRVLSLNQAAGGPSDAMGLLVTGHDANITGRLADMATAIDACSAADTRLAHFDSAACLPNFVEMSAGNTGAEAAVRRWLTDEGGGVYVHHNSAGAILTAAVVGAAMQAAVDAPRAHSLASGLLGRRRQFSGRR